MNEPRGGLRCLLVSGFGAGYMPIASGTFGSAVAIAISLACWSTVRGGLLDLIWVVLIVLASGACIVWGPWAVEYYAARGKKPGDPGMVVLDEFAGQWVSLIAIPMPNLQQAIAVLIVQFVLFRAFDVLKPPPARQLERLPAGWGILCDDLAAGIYANIIGQIIFRAIWPI